MTESPDRREEARHRRFPAYPEYKDSGVDWLGEIPAHWQVKKWRYCCHVTEGQIVPHDEQFRERVLIAPKLVAKENADILEALDRIDR